MKIVLFATIENFGEAGYIGYIDSLRGLVVQGKTVEKTIQELLISLHVKIVHDLGLDASALKQQQQPIPHISKVNSQEKVKFQLALA